MKITKNASNRRRGAELQALPTLEQMACDACPNRDRAEWVAALLGRQPVWTGMCAR